MDTSSKTLLNLSSLPFKRIVNCISEESRVDMEYYDYSLVIEVNDKVFNEIINELQQKPKTTIKLLFKNRSM